MQYSQDETFSDLLKALWHARLFLAAGAVAGIILAVLISMFAVPHYRVEMIVAPVVDDITLSSEQGGNSPLPSADKKIAFQSYLKILNGPAVVEQVFADGARLSVDFMIPRKFTFQKEIPTPDRVEISPYLMQQIDMRRNGDTALHLIRFDYPRPEIARDVLNQLRTAADHILRYQVMQTDPSRIDYLQQNLNSTLNMEHRRVLANLLQEQERLFMMAQMDRDYAAQIIEPPYIYQRRVWPRYEYIFPVFMLIGMTMGWILFGVMLKDE